MDDDNLIAGMNDYYDRRAQNPEVGVVVVESSGSATS